MGRPQGLGIVRMADKLGRVVIPMEIRRSHGIGYNSMVNMYVDGTRLIIEPVGCFFCGEETKYIFKDKPVCEKCRNELRSL